MGLKAGRVTELRIFFHVKPGHAELLKEACRKFVGGGARTSVENVLQVGIHDQSLTLFDNDTRFLFATTFDTDWDPYVEDSVNLVGKENYFSWLQHLEEFRISDGQPSVHRRDEGPPQRAPGDGDHLY